MRRATLIYLALAPTVLACASGPPRSPPAVTLSSAVVVSEPRLDDSEIATIANTIANTQAELARLANQRARDPAVRRFAGAILTNTPGAEIATIDLAPRPSGIDDQIASVATRAFNDVAAREGADFDQRFVGAEVRSLSEALGLIDDVLLPSVTNNDLRASLVQMRRTLADDLRDAPVSSQVSPHL